MFDKEIRYFGNPTPHGYDGEPLHPDRWVQVHFKNSVIPAIVTAKDIPNYDQSPDGHYPIRYFPC